MKQEKQILNILSKIFGQDKSHALLAALKLAIENRSLIEIQDILEHYVAPEQNVLQAILAFQHQVIELASQTEPKIILEFNHLLNPIIWYAHELSQKDTVNHYENEINVLNIHLERIKKHKSDFASVAAHELKTPLTLIDGYINVFELDFSEDELKTRGPALRGLKNGVERMSEIIENMIDVSAMDMGIYKINKHEVWFRQMFTQIMNDYEETLKKRDITITIDEESLPEESIEGDSGKIHQAFSQLISNAIKYTPNGGNVHIFGKLNDDTLKICIHDNGIGINQDDLSIIFDKFFTLGQTALHSSSKTKFKGGGPGLGLALTKGIIDAHGGEIWAESKGYDETALHGTRFYVTLPLIGSASQLQEQ